MSGPQYADGSVMAVEVSKESSSLSSGRTSGKSSSSDSVDGEEQEDPSSSSSSSSFSTSSSFDKGNKQVEDALLNFREKWQRELEKTQEKSAEHLEKNEREGKEKIEDEDEEEKEEEAREEKARKWFLQGVENEQKGKLYEAIQYYRKAVQLIPDIEFRLYETARVKPKERTETENSEDMTEETICCDDEIAEDEDEGLDMITKLQRFLARSRSLCVPQNEQKSTHISALPMEIVLYILRWVVSYDLDLRSLEMCSMVSRGFYLCCRDSEIWRMACLRVWGVNCGGLTNYDTWREMYLHRPRLNFNGCYISKTTYIRHGENSFQDQFYRPWHVVEYFRYLRFFPEGTVLMLTTPDQPVPALTLLKRRDVRNPSVLTGHYRLHDDRVTLVLRRQELSSNNSNNNNYRYRGRRNHIPLDLVEQSFHIELKVTSWKNKVNGQLQWKRYCVISKRGNSETSTNFEVMSNKFPPFWFSRVKSYTAESERPLM